MTTETARAVTTELSNDAHEPIRSLPTIGVTPPQMLALALERGADMAQLEKLMDLQERWEKAEAKKSFICAVNKFKANPPKITKNRSVNYETSKGTTAYRHASLGHICDLIGEGLGRVGVSYSWRTHQSDNGSIRVTCILTHDHGHSEETSLQSAADQSGGKNFIQAIGSTVTYLQRYTLLAATGMATDEQDDDGQGSEREPDPRVEEAVQQRKDSAPQTTQDRKASGLDESQVVALTGAIKKAGITSERFCESASINAIADLDGSRFKGAMQHLSNTADNKAKREQQQ